jgi:HPr kinase/phosphorylase
MKPKPKIPQLTVGEFFERHREALELELAGPEVGFVRRIREPTINRPGLALAGFYTYFAEHRIQVFGSAEMSYLRSLEEGEARARLRQMCERPVPCLVWARGRVPSPLLLEEAARAGIPVLVTGKVTMKFINAATIALEGEFAPTCLEHGSMVDIMGVGVLIKGSSGIGKSEIVLNLIERGYSLVSDDATRLRAIEGRELMGTAPEMTRNHMEVRGLGVIDVLAMFGVGAIRTDKRLDLVVVLKDWHEVEEVDRIGLDQVYYEVLGIQVPEVTIPVRVGRDLARLVEVAALDQKLKGMGQHSALMFNERLLRTMSHKKNE